MCVFDRKAFVTVNFASDLFIDRKHKRSRLPRTVNRGHAYKLSKTAEVTGTVLRHVAHRTLPRNKMIQAKLDEQNDNGMQEAEAKKEDVNWMLKMQ